MLFIIIFVILYIYIQWDGKIVKWSDRDETNMNVNNQEDEEVVVNNVPILRRSERIAEQRRAC